MFKNESMIIKEWLEHYLREGVDHFYLIDNGSTDDYWKKINIYEKYITLVKDPTRLNIGTQVYLYNKIYLNTVKTETKWLMICDVDEYIYSKNGFLKISDVLNTLPQSVEKIWLPWKIFGSNGHITHPDSVIKAFTKRTNDYNPHKGFGKTICKANNLTHIDCHDVSLSQNNSSCTANGECWANVKFTNEFCDKLNLQLNHYMVMSEEYYLKIKCTRGGGQSGNSVKYTIDYFKKSDKGFNDVVDTELFNKKYTK